MTTDLSIEAAIGQIRTALSSGTRLVLAAPPGAGKTTRLPLALLEEPWLAGKRILLLEPRRLAARLAAERMAATLGERVGETVGLATRVERKVSPATRIEVVTDGLAARRLIADPELTGIGAVLLDEFHERSLALDLALALSAEAQAELRPDLRLLVMSATLDTARIARRIGAPVIISEGRQYPVETIYLGRSAGEALDERMARAIRRALREQRGSILAFLPGQAEIRRVAERLTGIDAEIAPLYGALPPSEQDRATAPAPPGARKVVLATDIAESSLTIPDVTTVIDAGLARVAAYDPDGGSRLSTERASRASVDQRRGRAARTGPGVCYRLWDEEETRGIPAEPTPEILTADLCGLVLALAEWGERDPGRLAFMDPPPAGRLAAAKAKLCELGALDDAGAITERGRDMARLPLDPALAAIIVCAAPGQDRALAAEIAALLSERGLGGQDADLGVRLRRFRSDNAPRARALKAQCRRWAGDAAPAPEEAAGRIIAAALPSRIARARATEPGAFLLAGGRAAILDRAEPLAASPWLVVAEATGSAARARIVAAARLSEEDALALGRVETADVARYDPETKTIRARRVRRLGAIVIAETPLPRPPSDAAQAALIDALMDRGLGLLPAVAAVQETQARLALVRREFGEEWPSFADEELLARASDWLSPLFGDPPTLDRPQADEIRRAILSLLPWAQAREIEALAPLSFEAPTGRRLPINYLAPGGPTLEARVQEFYGLRAHPSIARGRVPLSLSLLSPAHRQVALTRDLPAFWSAGYRDMAKDMRGRYPKHDWPEDPAAARPHEGRTKARL